MDKTIRLNIKRSLECAVTVIDDFSDKVLKSYEIVVTSDAVPEQKAISKSDGFFIFLKGQTKIKRIKISGNLYSTQFVDIDEEKLIRDDFTITIYAKPNRAYPFPKDTTIVYGKAKPNEKISLICKTQIPSLTLLKDYDVKSNEIMLFSTDGSSIVGKSYALFGKDEKVMDFFDVYKKSDEKGLYHLKNPILTKITKSTAKIYRVYSTVADANGDYILPIKAEIDKECLCTISKDEKIWEEFLIKPSKYNVMDLV